MSASRSTLEAYDRIVFTDPSQDLGGSLKLSDDQRRDYDENGFVVVHGLFSPQETKSWRERFLAIVEGHVAPAEGMLMMRDVMVAKGAVAPSTRAEAVAKIQDFHSDPVLFETYCRNPRLLDLAESVIGSPDIKSIHNMLVNKPPGLDGRHPLHQDLLYFPFRPADAIVASWTAIDSATRENGCLVVVPGSHRRGLLPHENPAWEWLNFGYFGASGLGPETKRRHLSMEPGDTVFFHPLLLHGSGRNRTDGFRRAISCHYASARCRFLPGTAPIGKGRPYVSVRGRSYAGCI